MKWPDEIVNVKLWDSTSGKTFVVAMNRYDITPGMSYHSILRALDARRAWRGLPGPADRSDDNIVKKKVRKDIHD